jgi:hypothetical protein
MIFTTAFLLIKRCVKTRIGIRAQSDGGLLGYLIRRGIDEYLATEYCKEIDNRSEKVCVQEGFLDSLRMFRGDQVILVYHFVTRSRESIDNQKGSILHREIVYPIFESSVP